MASPAAILNIVVEANTGTASASLYRLQGTMDKTAVTAKGMNARIAGSSGGMKTYVATTDKATRATKDHHRATSKLGGVLKTAAASTAGFIAAYAGYAAVKSAVGYTNELVTNTEVLTRVTGLNVKTASRWIQLAEERNISAQKLGSSFGTLSKQIQGAKTGSETAAKGFQALGIGMDELKHSSTEKVLLKVSEGLKNTHNSAEKAALAQQLFGRGSRDLLPILANGATGVKKALDNFDGLSASQYKAGKEARNFQNEVARAYDVVKVKVSIALFEAGKATLAWIKETIKGKGAVGEFAKSAVASLRTFWKESGVVRAAIALMVSLAKKNLSGLIEFLQGWAKIIRGIVKIVSGVLTGDFGRAWSGVKDIFQGGVQAMLGILGGVTAPLRMVAAKAGEAMGNAFASAWDWIKDKFRDGVNFAIGFLNELIMAINLIPGIPDIGLIGKVGGGRSNPGTSPKSTKKDHGSKPATGRQRGGPIWGGDATGDSIPAMLERGEYVLNRKAVQALGKRQLDAINFGAAPRFSVGSFIGDAAKTAATPFGAAKAVGNLANKDAGYFIDKLPKPNLPEPFAALGPYVIGQVTQFIKDGFKSKKLGKFTSAMGGPNVPTGPIQQMAKEMLGIMWPGGGQWGAFNALEMSEAGWNPRAVNPESGAAGLAQALPPSKYPAGAWPYKGPKSAKLQLQWMMSYIKERYGSPAAAWAFHKANNWYQKGGSVGGGRKYLGSSFTTISGEPVNSSIAGLVASMIRRFDMDITAAYDPEGGHVSPGHNVTGTALDVVPADGNWDGAFAKGLEILSGDGFEVLYDGSHGTVPYPNHGRGNHAHIEMVGNGSTGGARKALRAFIGGSSGRRGAAKKAAPAPKLVASVGKGRSLAHHANIRQHNTAVHRNKQGVGRGAPAIHPAGGEELAAEGVSGEETDAQRESREATEALTAAIQEHKAVEEELKAELKRQTDFANEATATSSAVAWKALADILSGNLGAKTYHSAQTAGNGSLGSY